MPAAFDGERSGGWPSKIKFRGLEMSLTCAPLMKSSVPENAIVLIWLHIMPLFWEIEISFGLVAVL